MFQAGLVFGLRVVVAEVVVKVHEARSVDMVAELAVLERSLLQAEVHAGLVQGKRVEGTEHSDIRYDRGVVFLMAVAVRRDIDYEGYVELRASVNHGLGIFGHLAVQVAHRTVVFEYDCVEIAGPQTASAAYAVLPVYAHLAFFGVEDKSAVRAFLHTASASAAEIFVYIRLAAAVLLLLARTRAAAHADILDGAAEAGHFVAFEVSEADEDVRVHYCAAYLCRLHVFTAFHFDLHVIGALEAVSDYYRTAGRQGCEAVFPGAVEMLERVLPVARIHCVAVREERFATKFPDNIHNGSRPVRTQETDVPVLAEVHFDCDELAVQVQVGYPGTAYHLL